MKTKSYSKKGARHQAPGIRVSSVLCLVSCALCLILSWAVCRPALADKVLEKSGSTTMISVDEKTAGLTLQECYELALKRSESIGIQKEVIEETKGQMLQALSTALPRVSFSYDLIREDLPKNGAVNSGGQQGAFTFTQPLFTGFKEFAAIGASKHIGKQRAAELLRAKQLLFTDVSDAFFLYMSFQEDEATLLDIRKALFGRVGELKKRQKIGKSRPSEIASAESRLRQTEADLENTRAQREVVGQLLEFLVGRSFDHLVDAGDPEMNMTEDAAYAKADNRPDVVAARESAESFKQNVAAARSEFFPSVTLNGNAYTKRLDANEGNDWDVTLAVNVPLFNGMHDWGAVRQARAQKNEADFRLSLARRQALLDIRNSYTRWRLNGRRVAALEKAVTAAEKNLRLQIEDFQKSLVNNLDVLQALTDLQSVQRSLVAAKADARRSYWSLKVSTGDVE